MQTSKIIPINKETTASGIGQKANGIVQIQQPQEPGAWILADNNILYMNGLIIPSGGGLDRIISPDQTSQVRCLNNDEISMTGKVQGISTVVGAQISSDGGGAGITFQNQDLYLQADQTINLNTVYGGLYINNYPSSQYFVVYGQSKGEAVTQEQYHTDFPNAEIGQSDFNLRMFGYNTFTEWFNNQQYNPPNNSFIQENGSNFMFTCPTNTIVEISITWQLRYSFDGNDANQYLCCGLYNVDQGKIVPQSIQWQELNGIKFKYLTFKTTFVMSTNDQQYFPFFQQSLNGNQLTDTESGGLQRSSIQFKFYQFLNTPLQFLSLRQPIQAIKVQEETKQAPEITNITVNEDDEIQDLTQSIQNLTESLKQSIDNPERINIQSDMSTLEEKTVLLEIQTSKLKEKRRLRQQIKEQMQIEMEAKAKVEKFLQEAQEQLQVARQQLALFQDVENTSNFSVGSPIEYISSDSDK